MTVLTVKRVIGYHKVLTEDDKKRLADGTARMETAAEYEKKAERAEQARKEERAKQETYRLLLGKALPGKSVRMNTS